LPAGIDRVNVLNPTAIITSIEKMVMSKKDLDEIFIRRLISAIYFAIFNYWAAKQFSKGVRGKGPNQDSFTFSEFHRDLLKMGLDAEIIILFQCRVAVDHYIMNPASINIYNQEIVNALGMQKTSLAINRKILNRVISASKSIIKSL